jgi:hypothetical protein
MRRLKRAAVSAHPNMVRLSFLTKPAVSLTAAVPITIGWPDTV